MFGSTSRRYCRSIINRMLASAPYQVSAGEDKEESEEAQGDLHSRDTPGNLSGETGTSPSKSGREGQADIHSPHGKKRTASEDLKREASKWGKTSQSGDDADTQSPRKDDPLDG